MKKGFTLVELLVVVLIIGILTAVALPKYQTAVNKSRYAGLMPLARSVKNAEEVAYMANGEYAQLSDLSVGLPGGINQAGEEGIKLEVMVSGDKQYVKAKDTRINNSYVMYFDKSGTYPKEIHCEADSNNDTAKKVCQNLATDSTKTATATENNYTAYVIEGEGGTSGSGNASRGEMWSCEDEGGENVCRGEDADGVRYSVWGDGTTVSEEWTETDGTNTINYWGQCYDDEIDENYRCTSHSDFERYVVGQDGYEVCCGEQIGRTCSEWCEGD